MEQVQPYTGSVPDWYHDGMATNLRLRPDAAEAVRDEARRTGRSQQDVIRDAVDRYLGLDAGNGTGAADAWVLGSGLRSPRRPYRKVTRRLSLPAGTSGTELLARDERI